MRHRDAETQRGEAVGAIVPRPRRQLGFFAKASTLAAWTLIAIALITLSSCDSLRPSAAAPNPDLSDGPVSEADARRLAESASVGLRDRSPEMEKAFMEKGVRLLAHRDAMVREASAGELGELGRRAASALLVRALDDPAGAVRCAAAKALATAGESSAAGALVERLRDTSADVRAAAASALAALFSREPAALAPTDANSPAAPLEATARAAAAALADLLKDPDAAVRRQSAVTLGVLRAASALDAMGKAATGDADVQVRSAAVGAIGRIAASTAPNRQAGSQAGSTRPSADQDSNAHTAVGQGIGIPSTSATVRETAVDANACAALLVRCLGDESPLVRHAAVNALRAVGEAGELSAAVRGELVAALITRLRDRHAVVRSAAAFALGRLGDAAAGAALKDSAGTDPDAGVRETAREALGRIPPAGAGQPGKPR